MARGVGQLGRRAFLGHGLGALSAGLSLGAIGALGSRRAGAFPMAPGAWTPAGKCGPFLSLGDTPGASQVIGGLPYSPRWYGDDFSFANIPFHSCESCDSPPLASDTETDVIIIGGGISGLATAHALRDQCKFVVLDLRPRLGGNAMGESWRGLNCSLGSAYFMVPDKGDEFDSFYKSLGVYDAARIDEGGGFKVEYGMRLIDDLAQGASPEQRLAFARYRAMVAHYANDAYPDIPLSNGPEVRDVLRLDQSSFADHVTAGCGPLPPLVTQAIQAYCYSSFGVGWQYLSAAAGWNFIAAEEWGRIVLPGGNAGLVKLMHDSMRHLDPAADSEPGMVFRAGCMATDVRIEGDRVRVQFRDQAGALHQLRGKHAVVATSKHISRHFFPQMETLDREKWDLIPAVENMAYLVANVLLTKRVALDFYDIFTVHDAQFPMDDEAFNLDRRVTDTLLGSFAVTSSAQRDDILTMFWPLPWFTARFSVIGETDWRDYASLGSGQIRRALRILGLRDSDVAQVRLTRWGHAIPIAMPGQISSGLPQVIRRPVQDRVWFVNQDNWMLPAVETCLSEAWEMAEEIVQRL